jgi:drug/metabolite transporter (DMT)-like permease
MTNESKGMLYGFLGVLAFGLTLPAVRYVIDYFDPLFIALGRAVVAGIVALILLVLSKQPLPNKKQGLQLVVIALGVVIGFPVLSTWAMQTVPASHGGVVLGIAPLATAVVGVLISNDRPSIGFWLAGIAGSVMVVIYSLQSGGGVFQLGDIALLGAILSAAIGYAMGGQLSKALGGWQVICWALVISLPFISVPAWQYMPTNMAQIPNNIWLGFLYLALVSQLFAFFVWNKGLALGGVARVSQTQLVQPFVTIIASVLLLNETLDTATIVFALLVVSTVAISKKMVISKK